MKKLIYFAVFFFSVIQLSAQTDFEKPFDKWPMFPGCENTESHIADTRICAETKMYQYVYSNLEYPKEAKANKIEGRVTVTFDVAKNGVISNPRVSSSTAAFGCDEAALAIVQKMMAEDIRFIPAKKDDKSMDSYYNLPIRFKL